MSSTKFYHFVQASIGKRHVDTAVRNGSFGGDLIAQCLGHCLCVKCKYDTETWSGQIGNTLRPTQNGCHFADDILKLIFLNGNVWIAIEIGLNFVPKGPINNIPALVQIMAWCRPGDKSLSEPMMVSLLTDICVTRPRWVNASRPRQMANSLATTFWNTFYECDTLYLQILLIFVPRGLINDNNSIVQVLTNQ